MTPNPARPIDPLEPLRSPVWLTEARRKLIHLSFIVLPLVLLHEWLPWPRGKAEFRLVFLVAVVGAIVLDVLRIHEQRVRWFFRKFFGEMIREHERFSLLGSTYLLIGALLAIEIFAQPIAAAAVGFTVMGDAFAAIVGRAYGRHRVFGKSIEGMLGCLFGCLLWASYLVFATDLAWGVVLVGALVATLVEMLPIPLDDNLGITLIAGYSMKLLAGHP